MSEHEFEQRYRLPDPLAMVKQLGLSPENKMTLGLPGLAIPYPAHF
jgi:hypothetical protein